MVIIEKKFLKFITNVLISWMVFITIHYAIKYYHKTINKSIMQNLLAEQKNKTNNA
jgi:hypothetical protein